MHKRTLLTALSLVALAAVVAATANAAANGTNHASKKADSAVRVEVFAPRSGDIAGKQSKGFFVDLALRYPSLAANGADFQLTGPATHQNQGPFPGADSCFEQALALPFHSRLTESVLDRVAEVLDSVVSD